MLDIWSTVVDFVCLFCLFGGAGGGEYALLQKQLKTILYAKMNVPLLTILCFLYHFVLQSLVVRRPMSANPGLNFNPSFFFFCSKTPRKNFPTIFRA